jgi:tRNA threonylcarbamoyladenosine biosynthesis protein TsaE
MSVIRSWKKVYESDLSNIVIEMKEVLQTPCLLFLEGVVGAGKTTFSRAFIDNDKNIQSPTYSLVNEYDNILHADLYRIEKNEDLIHLEIPMYIEEKDYFIVEWGMKYSHALNRLVGDEFKSYELKIEINDVNSTGIHSRNYFLTKL